MSLVSLEGHERLVDQMEGPDRPSLQLKAQVAQDGCSRLKTVRSIGRTVPEGQSSAFIPEIVGRSEGIDTVHS
jgi:hypothetical protein